MFSMETRRLKLRSFTMDDLSVYHQMIYNDAEVTRYLPGGKPRSLDETRVVVNHFIQHERNHDFSVWAVEHEGKLIGHCGLVHMLGRPEVELVYALGKDYWGEQYAVEAARASLEYGFDFASLDDILAVAYPANVRSQRVMSKIGMHNQGITGQYYNTRLALYTLTYEQFEAEYVGESAIVSELS